MYEPFEERISLGLCPICGKEFGIIYKVVDLRITDSSVQKVKICKHHRTEIINVQPVQEVSSAAHAAAMEVPPGVYNV